MSACWCRRICSSTTSRPRRSANRFSRNEDTIMNTTRLVAALTLSLMLTPLAALAHVFPQKQEPGAGATVEAPARVTITFDGPLEPAFSSLTVTDAAGKQVSTAKSAVDAQQPSVASVALPALAA